MLSKKKRKEKVVARVVNERIKLLRIGDRLNLDGLEDLSLFQMKAKIIKAINPKMRLDGKGGCYIDAALDFAVGAMKSTDRQRKSIGRRLDSGRRRQTGVTTAEAARVRMNSKILNGGSC